MRRKPAIVIAFVAAGAFAPAAASACIPSPTPPPAADVAQAAFEEAAVVLDAEVIEVDVTFQQAGREWPWGLVVLRPLHVWKGPVDATYRLTVNSSCDSDPESFRVGGRYRLILRHDGDGYHADLGDNGLLGPSSNYFAAFNAEVDRLIGSARPPEF